MNFVCYVLVSSTCIDVFLCSEGDILLLDESLLQALFTNNFSIV